MHGAQILMIFLAMMGVSIVAFCIYSAWYRARISKALEEDQPVGPTPEPRRAGKLILLLGFAACVLGFLIWANGLQNRIAELEASIRSDMSTISNRIDQNYQSLITELRAENAVFAKFEYEVAEIDQAKRTVLVRVTAVPKEAAEGAAVSLRYGERELELQRGANGNWSGETRVTFGESLKLTDAVLSVLEEGRERSQKVDFYLQSWLWPHYPRVWASPDYLERNWKDGSVELKADVSITVVEAPDQMKSLSAVVRVDGKDVLEKDLSESISKLEDSVPEQNLAHLEGRFDLPESSEMTLLLRFTDQLGFLHEYSLCSFRGGNDTDTYNEMQETVYDTDGTVLLTDP